MPLQDPQRGKRPLRFSRWTCALALLAARASAAVLAQAGPAPVQAPLVVPRLATPIRLSGDLSDPGWKRAVAVTEFYEVDPGDNIPPVVRTTAYLAYDDRFFYAAFRCEDPDPSRIRAPYVDRDNVFTDQDLVAILLDTRGDGKTATQLRVNARGIQGDAVNNDANGSEDYSPDFYYEAAARIDAGGWTAEIRIPFSTLRYPKADPQTWGILLFRNYPRGDRRRMFSTPQPRGSSCFLCHQRRLEGLTGLPSGAHSVLAPFATARERASARPDQSGGGDLKAGPVRGDGGLDAKVIPGPDTVIDATLNPDFSQIESDVAQIGVNQRFALFYPEKRPFFLERVDLLQTPISAVYTRTITSPRWGARVTGESGQTSYTALVTQDRGGGSTVIPGPEFSRLAPQDTSSFAAFARVRQALGRSFAGLLATDRENRDGGHNRVVGPDFQWRPGQADVVTGQILVSDTRSPRSDASPPGSGGSGTAADFSWSRSTRRFDSYAEYQDFGNRFRADDGFVPQVGFRRAHGYAGWSFYPTGIFWHVRPVVATEYSADRSGSLLFRRLHGGVGFDGRWRSIGELNYRSDRVRTGGLVLSRNQVTFLFDASPSRLVSHVTLSGELGDEIDFEGHRPGTGGEVKVQLTLRPTDHLELLFDGDRSWVDVRSPGRGKGRLFTADVARVKSTYTFSARCFLRAIGQWVETRSDPSLTAASVEKRTGALESSALFGYRVNWQTVLFAGYGDSRALSETGGFERRGRQFFVKASWAFVR
ncbi:MAG: carbohydrate binding family 9 domain-containing protein [Acidobacteriota bacterium]|nr:carbohydrate binding family 9 domain-containing protein [Acidobacteriota bacterium]